MVDFIQDTLDRRMEVIEGKLRNSFRAVKTDNDEIRKKIDEISSSLKNNTFSKDIDELNKKVESNDVSFKKFKKDISVDGVRREVVKAVLPIFNEKIDSGLKLVKLENKEMRKDLDSFKNKWASASEEKLNKGLEDMRANFKKLDNEVKNTQISNIKLFEKQNSYSKFEIKAIKSSTKRAISEHKSLVDQYSAKIEDYSAELEEDFRKSKKEILSSSERKFDSLKEEHDSEVQKLKGQMAYLKGRITSIAGKDNAAVQSSVVQVSKPLVKEEAKKEIKTISAKKIISPRQKTRNFFSSIINSLADDVSNDKKETKITVSFKSANNKKNLKEVKKLGKEESDKSFLNKVVNGLADK